MVPFPMLPTTSSAERRLYEGFLAQLPEEYVVHHSVDWVTAGPRGPEEGEADFLVAHPVDGILVVEVKGGGITYDPDTRRWEQADRTGRHELAEDPFRQSSGAMHSLVAILSRVLGYRVDVRTPLRLAFNEEDRKIVELSEQQGRVRAMLPHLRAAVTGAAGSGKTVLAIELARRLAMAGTPTLLACFNRRLAQHLAGWTVGTPNLDVRHFHRLCYETAVEARLPMDAADDHVTADGSPYFDHELPDLLERAARTLGPRYDAIVVDEAQDFKQWWWPALLSLHTDPDGGRLYVFADANQDLYGGLAGGDGDGSFPVPLEDIVLLTQSRAAKSGLRARGGVDGFELTGVSQP